MDRALIAMLKADPAEKAIQTNAFDGTVAVVDENGKTGEPYRVKPLNQLYGQGTGSPSVEFADTRFQPLLIAIEDTVVKSYRQLPELTDGHLLAALEPLCMSPEADTRSDKLAARVQFALRLTLSLNDYSRQDVRHCLRKIKQSVLRHNKLAGMRGYLNFIHKTLP